MNRSPLKRRAERPRCRDCRERFDAKAWAVTCDACIERHRRAETARRHAQSLAATETAATTPRRVAGHTAPSSAIAEPVVKARAEASRRLTPAERDYHDELRAMGCCVCVRAGLGATPAEIHHVTESGRRVSHHVALPLCPTHHRQGTAEHPSRHSVNGSHGGRALFERTYGTEDELLGWVWRQVNKRRNAA